MAAISGRTGNSTAITGRSFPTRVAPRVELPASSSELAHKAAHQLGWHGVVLPEITMLGRRVCVVARLRTAVHAERIALGLTPVTDRVTVATWVWPDLAAKAPEPAAEIVGVLAVARHWRTAMAAAVPFSRYGEAAMVLPASTLMTRDYVENCLPRTRAFGLAVVAADEEANVDLDVQGDLDRPLRGGDAVSRWLNEMVYEQLLASYDLPIGVD